MALRKIVDRRYFDGYAGCNHGAMSVDLYLECGCIVVRKKSQEPKTKAECHNPEHRDKSKWKPVKP